ncbi:tyrosine--tRNA ligase [Myceligenerans indicum]|uniref:Tyrosine--tRNA ligase n=1 Tax=Myceligenerans indicum TaxID=2593663 RepID=A0ABS1LKY1_9MICO|nr:tyrosine--tRNA ligase [Myceligenerans indicum]MBL0886823.1 tyrosine--tRNA ligase [Myceligenerans indicum]
MTDVLDELHWRGLVSHVTDEAALNTALSEGPVAYYVGFDPTAPSLHIGNLVQILTARRLQDAGHKPYLLVGGATGLIGDPRDSGERTLNSPDVVAGWVDRIRSQIEPFLEFSGENAATMVNNLDWTAQMSAIEFLRDIGKHFRMGTMLSKEIVARRLNSEEGISYTEFSYQVLQGMDFRELHNRHGVALQLGGSDQWGNLLAGVELIRKSEGVAVHALTTPLITKADGTKFGKSEGGSVWLDPEMTSPYAFYQFWLNQADADVVNYLKVFTFRSREEIEALQGEVAERPFRREAQKALAGDVTTLVHGAAATEAVIAASAALFGRGELGELDERTLAGAVGELPRVTAKAGDLVVDLLVGADLVKSKGDARRAIKEGGAYVNNVKVTAEDQALAAEDLLHGSYAVLRRGKKTLAVAAAE